MTLELTEMAHPSASIEAIGRAARDAAKALAVSRTEQRNEALRQAAAALRAAEREILAANAEDMKAAEAKGLSGALLDRLMLDSARLEAMARGLEEIAALPDPLGRVLADWDRPNGLHIQRRAVPIGVIGIIYESRPNVTADAGGLCLKSGNAAILRGGSESFASSGAILKAMQQGLTAAGLPEGCLQRAPTRDRAFVGDMLRAHQWIDLIVPRGGRSLIERVMKDAQVPVLAHLDGNNHSYLHQSADLQKALAVTLNAKMRRPGICGATETLLVDRDAASRLLPPLLQALAEKGCELRGDARVRAYGEQVLPAEEADWSREYLDAVIAIKTVSGIEEALEHIARYGSGHTECIVAEDPEAAALFLDRVDAAIVMHNTSTQFADGGEFGMGAEIGIATGRLHARGPVGAEQLTSYKYLVRSEGVTRA